MESCREVFPSRGHPISDSRGASIFRLRGCTMLRPVFFGSLRSGAMMASISRIQLLERDNAAPEAVAIYDALLAQRGVVPNMFKILAYSPAIAQGVAGFLKPLLSDGALSGWY